ncbi:MAG: glycosyl hydrolase [Alphaproteobacteria bacterium]|nr:glycosyl hydrolase [Alphaproteobacteria bacterium]MDE2495209.1 glycosyl hydrolase [Alphaproteobacteria bacterium]
MTRWFRRPRSKAFGWSLALGALLIVPAVAPHAATPSPVSESLFKAMQWRGIGPYRGGRALAVTGVPGDPYTFYFGAVAGGIWKTTDAGATWEPLTDHTAISSIGAIAVAPSNHKILYAGTGEGAPRGNITYGDGVYKSLDDGKTWTSIGLKDTRQIGALIVDPNNPDIVLVAALGHAFGPNTERGVFRTADGGKTWAKVLYKDDKTGAVDVTFDPHDSKIVYASLWQMRRQPWNFSSGGPGSGLYRSTDGGLTWTQLAGNGLPSGILGKIEVSVSGADSKRVYAMIEAKDGGLFRSDDAGGHWRRVNDDGRLRQRAWYFSTIYADPKNVDTVYAENTGLFRSTDGGKTFKLLPARHGDHHGLWIDPTDPDRMIDGSDGGASISFDGGKTWTTQDNQPTAQFYHVAVDNRFPYYVYGAQQDNTSIAIASRDDEGAIGPRDWYDVGGGECGFVIPDPRDPDIVYSDAENMIFRFNKHTEQTRVISVWPLEAAGHAASDLAHRFNWTSPMILSPHNSDTLYVGMERLFKSTDDGNSWTAISGDLTRNDKSKQYASGGPLTKDITSVEYYDTIFAIAESPLKKGLLWVGTDDGLVQLTGNDGATWTNVTPHDMPAWSTISMIEPSHFSAGTAYVAVDRHKLDDIRPYVFKTTDEGKSWTRIDVGLPDGAVVRAVREDPKDRNLLYAATETGVFVSFDAGRHWQSLQLNLPRSPVRDLVVKGDDLVVATHGRSFWILDDVTPLRQMAAASAAKGAFLYVPETTYRLYYPDSVDARPPVGQNPPAGAVIDYVLPSKPIGEVTIDILDAKGHLVRHLSSKASKESEQPPEWPDEVHPSKTLPTNAGMNRFVWDLRYDDPAQIPSAFYEGLPPRGPIVLPGTYTLKLAYGGRTQTATLTVARDPRVHGPQTGLDQKFALSMEVYRDQDALHRAVNDIRDVKAKLAALQKTPNAKPALLTESKAIADQAEQIEDVLMQVHAKGSEANLAFPDMLNEQIYAFAAQLEDADTAPTVPERTTYAALHTQLGTQLAAWAKLKGTQLAAFRAQAKQAGITVP